MGIKLDLIGQTFGKLTVLSEEGRSKFGKSIWKCSCVCGQIVSIIGSNLKSKKSTSCSKCKIVPDLVGQKINNVTVLEFVGFKYGSNQDHSLFKVIDDEGKIGILKGVDLTRKNVNKSFDIKGKDYQRDRACKAHYFKYRSSAKSRGFVFELNYNQFKDLVNSICYYCDSEANTKSSIVVKGKNITELFNGVDRKDSSIGYTPENCVPCCKSCNRAKNNLSIDEWMSLIKRLVAKWS